MFIQAESAFTQTLSRLVRNSVRRAAWTRATTAIERMSSRSTETSRLGLAFAQVASSKGSSPSSMV